MVQFAERNSDCDGLNSVTIGGDSSPPLTYYSLKRETIPHHTSLSFFLIMARKSSLETSIQSNVISGQIETMMPTLLDAMEAERIAKENVNKIKDQMAQIIESPQTISTAWGAVILNKGRRTVKVTDRALNAKLTMLKEEGISEGKCEESIGDPFITIRRV